MDERESEMDLGTVEDRVPAEPIKGVALGIGIGLVLLLYVAIANPPMLAEEDLTLADMAMVYLGGGALSGLIGGLLWPYQRTRKETLIFAIPTAVPVYAVACLALGASPWLSLAPAVVGGAFYSAVYGGEHRRLSENGGCREPAGGSNGT